MALTRSRPGDPNVRKSNNVGPDYPKENFRNPWNAGVDRQAGSTEHKTLESPTATFEGPDVGLNHSYDKYWEGH